MSKRSENGKWIGFISCPMQCVGSGDVKTVGFGFNIYLIS
jgi:hypothetical protein